MPAGLGSSRGGLLAGFALKLQGRKGDRSKVPQPLERLGQGRTSQPKPCGVVGGLPMSGPKFSDCKSGARELVAEPLR
jgi:hypothetical protein